MIAKFSIIFNRILKNHVDSIEANIRDGAVRF